MNTAIYADSIRRRIAGYSTDNIQKIMGFFDSMLAAALTGLLAKKGSWVGSDETMSEAGRLAFELTCQRFGLSAEVGSEVGSSVLPPSESVRNHT